MKETRAFREGRLDGRSQRKEQRWPKIANPYPEESEDWRRYRMGWFYGIKQPKKRQFQQPTAQLNFFPALRRYG